MEEKDLEKMTAVELREFALKNHPDITGVHAMKKEELVKAIHQARGEAGVEKKKKEPLIKVPLDKPELKKRIRLLNTETEKLLQDPDKKKLSRLRKKIKHLKRLTKRAA